MTQIAVERISGFCSPGRVDADEAQLREEDVDRAEARLELDVGEEAQGA